MNHSTVQMIKVRCWTQMKVGIVLQQTKASIIAVKVTVRWFLPCAWKDKSNPASHHSSPLSPAIPSASLADMRKIQCANQRITSQQEFVIESLKCLSAKTLSTNSQQGVFENIIHQRMAGCYMLGEENRHYVAFEACSGCAGEAISMSVCLCVGSGMKGLWISVYRQVPATSRRQQRPEALIYHWTVIRHTFFHAGTR